MHPLAGYVLTVVGAGLVFGGTVLSFSHLDTTLLVVVWGSCVLLGAGPLVVGLSVLLHPSERGERPNPDRAPGKTGSPFGPR
jgi:uncharacterized membrane protein